MEYSVRIKNAFRQEAVLEELKGRHSLLNLFSGPAPDRPFLTGTNSTFSSGVLAQLHRANAGRPAVHETTDYALYFLSSLGGREKDYYRINGRTRIYDSATRWAYWETAVQSTKPTIHTNILEGPLDNLYTNSPFGKVRGGKPHGGTDYPVPGGTPYYATAKGKIVRANFSTTYGNVIIIDHGSSKVIPGKVYTVYAHASKLLITKGHVKTGDVIALTGNTGRVKPAAPRGYHGHYEVICTTHSFGSKQFYAYDQKYKPSKLRWLLTGN